MPEIMGGPTRAGRWKTIVCRGTETGDRRNVPQFFDKWEVVNFPSVPSFSI
jgi:hypothetical protein